MGCMLNGYMMYGLSTQCERMREKVGSTGVPGKLEPANTITAAKPSASSVNNILSDRLSFPPMYFLLALAHSVHVRAV